VDRTEQLFHKWQNWLTQSLLTEFQRLLHNQRIFDAYLESLNSFIGKHDASEIAVWMGVNYYEAMCVVIRRLDDADKRSISLRVLLSDLRENATVLTEENLVKYTPAFRATPGAKPHDREMESVLSDEIALLDRFGRELRIFVNKRLAHHDAAIPQTATVPNLDVVDRAIFCYHAIFRKYAFLIAGIRCNLKDPDPLDILPPGGQNHKEQFTRLWASTGGNETLHNIPPRAKTADNASP
jgi:hypothetical protein